MQTAGQAQSANPVLVFTEKSDTILTATIGGADFGSVTLISPDNWTWSLPANRPPLSLLPTTSFEFWIEPDSTATKRLGNIVQFNSRDVALAITSDLDFTNPFLDRFSIPNNGISLNKFSFHYTDGTVETFSVQFNDLGDVASNVPDNASTLGMMGLSAAAMFGFRRARE
jgi:hypothetical protein